jgi:hypothetical protein
LIFQKGFFLQFNDPKAYIAYERTSNLNLHQNPSLFSYQAISSLQEKCKKENKTNVQNCLAENYQQFVGSEKNSIVPKISKFPRRLNLFYLFNFSNKKTF